MKKLSKAQVKHFAAFSKTISQLAEAANEKIALFNEALQALQGPRSEVEDAIAALNAEIESLNASAEEASDLAQETWDNRSERWQESDSGAVYGEWIDALREAVEEVEIEIEEIYEVEEVWVELHEIPSSPEEV